MFLLAAMLLCPPQGEPPRPSPRPAPGPQVVQPATTPTATAQDPAPAADAWCTPERAARCAAAADRGLAWLIAHQHESGAWLGIVGHKMGNDYVELDNALSVTQQRGTGQGHLGVTALAGMAFLAGGHLPGRGEYGGIVKRTNDYVVSRTLESGLLTSAGTRMYSHAFATLFLAEIHGMTATGSRKSALERAVHLIVDSQNEVGGWRYNPFTRATDLSVTVCQLQALRAARNIGIHVPSGTIERAMAYVSKSRVERGRERGLYYYKIYGDGRYQKSNQYAINAAALTALSSAGIYDDDLTDPALRFLEDRFRDVADYQSDHFFYYYGNYYAAQAFFQRGGAHCRRFFAALSDDLLRKQRRDGSWRNRPGPGDEFSTAVACILLQMPRQYLPIFQR
ncbi:MAG: prenyltransferase [bacterium]|nr:prenyltransferase [bacterium]